MPGGGQTGEPGDEARAAPGAAVVVEQDHDRAGVAGAAVSEHLDQSREDVTRPILLLSIYIMVNVGGVFIKAAFLHNDKSVHQRYFDACLLQNFEFACVKL